MHVKPSSADHNKLSSSMRGYEHAAGTPALHQQVEEGLGMGQLRTHGPHNHPTLRSSILQSFRARSLLRRGFAVTGALRGSLLSVNADRGTDCTDCGRLAG